MQLNKLTTKAVIAITVLLTLAAVLIALSPFAGWRVDTVLSGSMEPAIATGGLVVIGPVAPGDVRAGDVIAFRDGNIDVCHRVLGLREGTPAGFITKGDANPSPDPVPVSPNNVIGKVVVSVPYAGYGLIFVKTPLGLFVTILLPLLALIGMELKKLVFDGDDVLRGTRRE